MSSEGIDAVLGMFPDATEFQKIVLREALTDADGIIWPPQTPEEEEAIRRIGAIALEVIGRPGS